MSLPKEVMDKLSSTKDLWDNYKLLYSEDAVEQKDYESVKYGINLNFDIREFIRYTEGMPSNITPKIRNGKIIINKQQISLSEFEDEIEARENVMRQAIYDNLGTETIKPRINNEQER